jgi:hypothetical protein
MRRPGGPNPSLPPRCSTANPNLNMGLCATRRTSTRTWSGEPCQGKTRRALATFPSNPRTICFKENTRHTPWMNVQHDSPVSPGTISEPSRTITPPSIPFSNVKIPTGHKGINPTMTVNRRMTRHRMMPHTRQQVSISTRMATRRHRCRERRARVREVVKTERTGCARSYWECTLYNIVWTLVSEMSSAGGQVHGDSIARTGGWDHTGRPRRHPFSPALALECPVTLATSFVGLVLRAVEEAVRHIAVNLPCAPSHETHLIYT